MHGPDPTLERRRFLALSALGAALLPARLANAFSAGGERDGVDPLARLARAFDQARRLGRPLLVLTVPEERRQRRLAGEAWGQVLTHGSTLGLADLALCEIACARSADLRAALGARVGLPAAIRNAVLVETDGSGATSSFCRPLWKSAPGAAGYLRRGEREAADAAREAWIRARIARVEAELHAAIAADADALASRAVQAAGAFGDAAPRVRRHGLTALDLSLEEGAERVPAVVRWECEVGPLERARGLQALAVALERRLALPPAGAHWASTTPCGWAVENPQPDGGVVVEAMGCGRGHVPAFARRFLDFLTER